MDNNFVYGGHVHTLVIYGHRAWKRLIKSEKTYLLQELLFVIQNVLFKIHNYQNWPQQFFFCIKLR